MVQVTSRGSTRRFVLVAAVLLLATGCRGGVASSTPTVTVTATPAASSTRPSAPVSRHCAESSAIIDGPGDGVGADLILITLDLSDSGQNLIVNWELDQMPPAAQRLSLSISVSSMAGSHAGQIGAHVEGGKVSDVYMMRPDSSNVEVHGPTVMADRTISVAYPLSDVTDDYGSQFVWWASASVDGGEDDLAPDNATDGDHPSCDTFTVGTSG